MGNVLMARKVDGSFEPETATRFETLEEAVSECAEWLISAQWVDFGGFPCIELMDGDDERMIFSGSADDPYVKVHGEFL